jgi:metal-responsive CopG/Arc/MetJ family transcriptional regulator
MMKTQVATNVSANTLAAIDKAAKAEAISRSAFIRRALEKVLKSGARQ